MHIAVFLGIKKGPHPKVRPRGKMKERSLLLTPYAGTNQHLSRDILTPSIVVQNMPAVLSPS